MPSLGIHLLVADEARSRLGDTAPEAVRAIEEHRRLYDLGAMAQDLLYFAPQSGPLGRPVIDLLNQLLMPFEQLFKIPSGLRSEITDGLDLVTGSAFSELLTAAESFCAALKTVLADLIARRIDPWELILSPPPLGAGQREAAWSWGDLVHYRCTGRFAQALYDRAGSDRLKAFALGSATHIGSDTVVHPFVNAIVGGPFRNHPHRHHFVENFLDTLAWDRLRSGANVLDQELFERINVTGGVPIPGLFLAFAASAALPDDVTELLTSTLREVYPTPPDYPSAGELTIGYRVFLLLTRLTYHKIDPPVPPQIDLPDLLDLLRKLALDPPPGLPGELCFTPACAQDLFESILDFVDWAADQLGKIADFVASAGAAVLELAKDAARYVFYLVEAVIYNLYRAGRRGLVWMGLMAPFDLAEAVALDREYSHNDKLGKGRSLLSAMSDLEYPRRQSPTGFFGRLNLLGRVESMHHVPYPRSGHEAPGPFGFLDRELETVLRDRAFSEADVEALLAATSPDETYTATAEFASSLGNASDFSAYLIRQALGNDLARHRWNLDGDRGYAWQTWSWRSPHSPGTAEVDAFYVSCEP